MKNQLALRAAVDALEKLYHGDIIADSTYEGWCFWDGCHVCAVGSVILSLAGGREEIDRALTGVKALYEGSRHRTSPLLLLGGRYGRRMFRLKRLVRRAFSHRELVLMEAAFEQFSYKQAIKIYGIEVFTASRTFDGSGFGHYHRMEAVLQNVVYHGGAFVIPHPAEEIKEFFRFPEEALKTIKARPEFTKVCGAGTRRFRGRTAQTQARVRGGG